MLIRDEALQDRHAVISPQEAHMAKVKQWAAEQARHCIYVQDDDLSPGNAEKQLGTPLMSEEFERRLAKVLPPNCKFITHPIRPWIRVIIRVFPDGTSETICPYERGLMPEHSILRIRTEWVRDFSTTRIDRKDLPKADFIPGVGHVFEKDAPRPGWRKIYHLCGEDPTAGKKTRGWRTVLIRCVEMGVITPTAAEREFGVDDSPQWAAHLGKQKITLPW